MSHQNRNIVKIGCHTHYYPMYIMHSMLDYAFGCNSACNSACVYTSQRVTAACLRRDMQVACVKCNHVVEQLLECCRVVVCCVPCMQRTQTTVQQHIHVLYAQHHYMQRHDVHVWQHVIVWTHFMEIQCSLTSKIDLDDKKSCSYMVYTCMCMFSSLIQT